MKIIGCDFHTRQQRIEMLDTETGEIVQVRLEHPNGEARRFYEQLRGSVIVGIEATGYTRWFERMLAELGHELWVGDAAQIRASVVRKQKNDERDATHLRKLMSEDRFPKIWMPTVAERDLRQLVLHRVKLVQMRTKVMNQLHAIAMGQGLCRKKKLWSKAGRQELEALALEPWASRRRKELLELLDQMEKPIAELDRAVEEQAVAHPAAARLITHPGVGPLTSLAFVLTIGEVERFGRSRQVSSQSPAELLGGSDADRIDQQAGQLDDAMVAGRSGADGGTERCGTATAVSAAEIPSRESDCEGGGGAPPGREVVLDAAASVGLHGADGAAGSFAG
jgi:transposase